MIFQHVRDIHWLSSTHILMAANSKLCVASIDPYQAKLHNSGILFILLYIYLFYISFISVFFMLGRTILPIVILLLYFCINRQAAVPTLPQLCCWHKHYRDCCSKHATSALSSPTHLRTQPQFAIQADRQVAGRTAKPRLRLCTQPHFVTSAVPSHATTLCHRHSRGGSRPLQRHHNFYVLVLWQSQTSQFSCACVAAKPQAAPRIDYTFSPTQLWRYNKDITIFMRSSPRHSAHNHNLLTNTVVAIPAFHKDVIREVAPNPKNTGLVATGGFDGNVFITDIEQVMDALNRKENNCNNNVFRCGDIVGSVAWNPQGDFLFFRV